MSERESIEHLKLIEEAAQELTDLLRESPRALSPRTGERFQGWVSATDSLRVEARRIRGQLAGGLDDE